MASGGVHGKWSTHVRMYECKWPSSAIGPDLDDLPHVLGLNACGAY